MSDEPEVQTELTETSRNSTSQSRHKQILDLYSGESIGEVAIGLWAKIVVEFVIVAAPLAFVMVLPGLILAYFEIGPFSYPLTVTAWITVSTTVFGITWCFLESDPVTETESDEYQVTGDQE